MLNHYENLYYYEKVVEKVNKVPVEVVKQKSFVNKWLKDKKILTYERVDFIPIDIYDAQKKKTYI